MCYGVTCACGKKGWRGCGQHLDSVYAGVPESDRCPGWKTGNCPSGTASAGCVVQ